MKHLIACFVLMLLTSCAFGQKWNSPIICAYDDTGSIFAKTEVEAAINHAMQQWRTGTALQISYAGTVRDVGQKPCLIRWLDLVPPITGNETPIVIGGYRVATTITLSRAIRTVNNLTHVVTHEIGHGIGLQHNQKGWLMYPSMIAGATVAVNPNISDIAQVSKLYPKHLIDGKPEIDCEVRLYANNTAYLPVVDGGKSIELVANGLQWTVRSSTDLATTINVSEYYICGQ